MYKIQIKLLKFLVSEKGRIEASNFNVKILIKEVSFKVLWKIILENW